MPSKPLSFSGHSYDNTVQLDANTWRHVAFIEQQREVDRRLSDPGLTGTRPLVRDG